MRLASSRTAAAYILSDYGRRYLAAPAAIGLHAGAKVAFALGSGDLASSMLMRAHRAVPSERITEAVVTHRDKLIEYSKRYVRSIPHRPGWVQRCIVLRLPGTSGASPRKGVLLIKFTSAAAAAAASVDVGRLCERFHVVLEPSWAGYCSPEILAWCNSGAPVIVQCSARIDRELLQRLGTNLLPVEFGASDWVDHRIFRPLNLDRSLDSVYVANLSRNKRLHAYLAAVSQIVATDSDYRGAVVCGDWGGRRETLNALVEHYGVREHVASYFQLSQAELNEILNRAKVNVLMSLKEGSNKSLFESMFAGTPVIALTENVSINQDYINEQTGRLATHRSFVRELAAFRQDWGRFQPRKWAMTHISPQATTRKLTSFIQELDGGCDHRQSDGLLVKVNAPEATYWDAAEAGNVPEISELLRPFMISVG